MTGTELCGTPSSINNTLSHRRRSNNDSQELLDYKKIVLGNQTERRAQEAIMGTLIDSSDRTIF